MSSFHPCYSALIDPLALFLSWGREGPTRVVHGMPVAATELETGAEAAPCRNRTCLNRLKAGWFKSGMPSRPFLILGTATGILITLLWSDRHVRVVAGAMHLRGGPRRRPTVRTLAGSRSRR
jgi:hypothetical protein